jgi:hypothetical protein
MRTRQNCITSVVGLIYLIVSCTAVMGQSHQVHKNHKNARTDNGILSRSPDGKYAVRYTVGDASIPDKFVVFFAQGKCQQSNLLSIKRLYKVNGYLWAPNKPHTLFFAATRLTNEAPFIGKWQGMKGQFKIVVKGTLPDGEDPDTERMEILGVSPDGHSIQYRHEQYWLAHPGKGKVKSLPL